MIGSKHAALKDAYFATFDDDIRKFTGKELGIDLNEIDKKMIELMQYIKELYSNSGMNSRLEQPAVRKSVRKGALFV